MSDKKKSTDTDTKLLAHLKDGDKSAANLLIERYFDRVIQAASRRISQRRLRATGSEDIAASVFESLWKKADQQQFDENDLNSSDEFWRLLCTMVRFKTEDHLRRERAQKRGGDNLRGESIFQSSSGQAKAGIAGFSDKDIGPAEMAAFRDQHEKLMAKLNDATLQEVVTLRLEGKKVAEIAQHFNKSERWVKRKLALIREIWHGDLKE